MKPSIKTLCVLTISQSLTATNIITSRHSYKQTLIENTQYKQPFDFSSIVSDGTEHTCSFLQNEAVISEVVF